MVVSSVPAAPRGLKLSSLPGPWPKPRGRNAPGELSWEECCWVSQTGRGRASSPKDSLDYQQLGFGRRMTSSAAGKCDLVLLSVTHPPCAPSSSSPQCQRDPGGISVHANTTSLERSSIWRLPTREGKGHRFQQQENTVGTCWQALQLKGFVQESLTAKMRQPPPGRSSGSAGLGSLSRDANR